MKKPEKLTDEILRNCVVGISVIDKNTYLWLKVNETRAHIKISNRAAIEISQIIKINKQ